MEKYKYMDSKQSFIKYPLLPIRN